MAERLWRDVLKDVRNTSDLQYQHARVRLEQVLETYTDVTRFPPCAPSSLQQPSADLRAASFCLQHHEATQELSGSCWLCLLHRMPGSDPQGLYTSCRVLRGA